MTDKKISDLSAASALSSTDLFEIRERRQKKITASIIGEYCESRPSLAEIIRDVIGATLQAGANMSITVNDGGDSILLSATGTGSSAPKRHPGYVPGRWYRPGAYSGTNSTLTVNNLTATPFVVAEDVTVTDLGIRVVTGATGSIVLGIYTNHSNNHVPDLLLAQTSPISVSSSGVNASGALPSSLSLSAGVYWMAHLTDATPLVSGMAANEGQLAWSLGTTGSNIATCPQSFSVGLTYATSLPSIYTSGGAPNTVAAPIIAFKIQ